METNNTAIINLVDKDGNIFNTYCIDRYTNVQADWNYSLINLEDSSYINQNTSDKIRNIVINAYPFVSLEYVQSISGIVNLTKQEAIAATQAAIWHYANGDDITLENNEKYLYDFYINMGQSNSSPTNILNIDINYKTYFEEGVRTVLISFDSKNIYDLEYSFDKDLVLEYGVTLEENNNEILIKNVPLDAEFEITVLGKQKINKDVYFFSPYGGKSASQSLVGVTSGIINVSNSKVIKIEDNYYQVNINKKDSITSKNIANVTFKLSNTSDFSEYVFEKTTDENGIITFDNIPNGTWYLKEISAPDGYIIEESVLELEVANENINLEIFNEPNVKTGSLVIRKLDSGNMKILAGSTIHIYKDSNYSDLFLEIVTTDEDFVIKDIPVGTYYIKEIKSPDGYILNIDEFTVEIIENNSTKIEILNHRIYHTGSKSNCFFIIGISLSTMFAILFIGYNLWQKKHL